MGSLCSSSQVVQGSSQMDPRAKQFRDTSLDIADQATSRPYENYGEQRLAGFSGDTQNAMNQVRQGMGSSAGAMNSAMGAASRVGQQTAPYIGADRQAATQRGGNIGDRYTMGGDRGAPTSGRGPLGNMQSPDVGANMKMFQSLMQGGANPGDSNTIAGFFGRLNGGQPIQMPQTGGGEPMADGTPAGGYASFRPGGGGGPELPHGDPREQFQGEGNDMMRPPFEGPPDMSWLSPPPGGQPPQMFQPQMQDYTGDVERANVATANAQTLDPSTVERVQAGTVAGSNIAPYMNQYRQAALDPALQEIQRQADFMRQGNAARASSAGAYGGSRHALLDSETQRNALQQMANTEAQGMAQGFDTSSGLLSADLARQLQAAQGNQGFGNQALFRNQDATNQFSLANQQATNQFSLANQQAANAMSQFNATQRQSAAQRNAELKQQTNLANQQANLSQQGLNLQGAQTQGNLAKQGQDMRYQDIAALADVGKQNQAMDQSNMDMAYQDWLTQQQYPLSMLNVRNQTLAGQPVDKTVYGQGPNNTASYAGLFASLLGGAGKFGLFG